MPDLGRWPGGQIEQGVLYAAHAIPSSAAGPPVGPPVNCVLCSRRIAVVCVYVVDGSMQQSCHLTSPPLAVAAASAITSTTCNHNHLDINLVACNSSNGYI